MEATLKIKNLIPGVYVIDAYESIQSTYGETYKIYTIDNCTKDKIVFGQIHF